MTVLKNGEVQALAHLYFLDEAGRPGPSPDGFLSLVDGRSPQGKAPEYVRHLTALGFIDEVRKGHGDKESVEVGITPEGMEWFERNAEGWRACNQFSARPKQLVIEPPTLAER